MDALVPSLAMHAIECSVSKRSIGKLLPIMRCYLISQSLLVGASLTGMPDAEAITGQFHHARQQLLQQTVGTRGKILGKVGI